MSSLFFDFSINIRDIVNFADSELRAVIHVLSAKGLKSVDIQTLSDKVYGQSSMSDGMVRRWVRAFKDGCHNVQDEKRTGRPSVINEDLLQQVDRQVRENRHFTISLLS